MRSAIESASREWRNGLIDVGGNNRLLHYRNTASTLLLDDAPQTALAKLFSGSEVRLSELVRDGVALDRAQKVCASLARKQREAVEEYGISVTYLAAGMASWDPEGNPELRQAEASELAEVEEAGAAAKTPKYTRPRAPVLMRPVELELRRGAQQVWVLRLADDFQVNGVLTHVINADRLRVVDDEVTNLDSGVVDDIAVMHKSVKDSCSDVAEFSIEPTIVLGAFSYAKQPMVDDVADVAALESSDLVSALAGDSLAAERVRAFADDVTESTPDYRPIDSEYLVLDADASQSFVVNAALAGRNLVVEGPPGTGKSQTIANIIATSAAQGKTVLFVAQKRAAISAVLDRLKNVELEHLVLDVFAAASSRRFVADQLRESLDRQKSAGRPLTDELHFSLGFARDRLVRHREAMHAPSRGWGISVADLMVMAAATPEDVKSETRLSSGVISRWSELDLVQFRSSLTELSDLGALETEWSSAIGWAPSAITGDAELRESNNLLMDIQARYEKLTDELARLASAVGGAPLSTWPDVAALAAQLQERDRIAEMAPHCLVRELTIEELETALLATSRGHRKLANRKLTWTTRRSGVKRARSLVGHLARSSRGPVLAAALQLRSAWLGSSHLDEFHEWTATADLAMKYVADLGRIDGTLQGLALGDMPITQLPGAFIKLAKDPRRRVMPRVYAIKTELVGAGLAPLLVELEARSDIGGHQPARAALVFDRVVSSSLLDEALLFDSELATLTGKDLSRSTAEFQRHDLSHFAANAVRIRRLAAERLKHELDARPDQHVILKKEVTRKARFTPIRRLLREVPDVVLAAKPIWAMSPLQVSRLLPRRQMFDLVIFDEASQVKPADAIPAILRGRQVIVAGDSRQLPPTEFFTKTLGDSDEEIEEDEDVGFADEISDEKVPRKTGSLTRDAESILFAMDRLLAGQSRRLLWHYRSRDERLITVSNRYVYDRSLTTFPAADTPDAIEHIVVAYSPGIAGTTNSPEAEVTAVVEAVKRHASERPNESLGVIAFGMKHQHRIEAALDQAFIEDPSLYETLNAVEPFFVKSIERVQGDERDAILLTVGYGRSKDGQLRLFWGPLLKEGGERRLNVAISRAKQRITLISSFSDQDLAVDAHHSRGYQLMYQFVRFVASRGAEIGDGPNNDAPLNAFEIDIRDKLEAAGLRLDTQVGVGSYRIDFAARHPDKPGMHVLAIEADGASYHSGHTARERDRLRQQLLEKRGWVFHRIWSTDWFNDAQGQVDATVAAYFAAVHRNDSSISAPDEDPRAWESAIGKRNGSTAGIRPNVPIDHYSDAHLITVVRWVRSDDVVRSLDAELAEVMAELGFRVRGSKIVRRISEAQARA